MATNPPVQICAACGQSRAAHDYVGTNELSKDDPCQLSQCRTFVDPLPSVTPETYNAEQFKQFAALVVDRDWWREANPSTLIAKMLRYAATLARDVETLRTGQIIRSSDQSADIEKAKRIVSGLGTFAWTHGITTINGESIDIAKLLDQLQLRAETAEREVERLKSDRQVDQGSSDPRYAPAPSGLPATVK